jgi:hypothetical protein
VCTRTGRPPERLALTTPALRFPRDTGIREMPSDSARAIFFTHCQAVPRVVNVLEPGSIDFQIVEFWQLKCTATISMTQMCATMRN